ncbi:MAG: ABC transporter permease [Puniceicoccaceae bacterium]|nr:MAG: ABC transporter permease [Puniceicoccaceae bacterium]
MFLLPAAAALNETRFHADLEALTLAPHRLPGSGAQAEAMTHIRSRLEGLGLDEVHELPFDSWTPVQLRSEMRVDGETLPIQPMRPNLMIWPNTPEEGLRGRILYAAAGELTDYGSRDPEGAIVMIDYSGAANWRLAFSLGARAVIFHGRPGDTPADPIHTTAPANLMRFFLDAADVPDPHVLEGRQVTIFSQTRWEARTDTVVFARVQGTDPEQRAPVILATDTDAFGNVPFRSPGARAAANSALLLQYAEQFAANRPARDVGFLFTSSRMYRHQGARYFYEAFTLPERDIDELMDNQALEASELGAALELFRTEGLRADAGTPAGALLLRQLNEEASFLNDDLTAAIQRARLSRRGVDEQTAADIEAQLNRMLERRAVIDEFRRALFRGTAPALLDSLEGDTVPDLTSLDTDAESQQRILREIFPDVAAQLLGNTRGRLERRLAELADTERFWERARALRTDRDVLPGVHLHISLNLGDAGSRWGVVIGDPVFQMMNLGPIPAGDQPGNYVRIISQLNDLARDPGVMPHLSRRSLLDTRQGPVFAGEPFTSSAKIAGMYAVYNLALMTENDARLRDGHPADTREALDTAALLTQGGEALTLINGILGIPNLGNTRSISRIAGSKRPEWRNGRPWGDFASRTVVGGLAESRPAENALLAHWPTPGAPAGTHWSILRPTDAFRDFMPVAFQRANAFGRFPIIGHRELRAQLGIMGAYFNEDGSLNAVVNQASQIHPRFGASLRLNLFRAEGHVLQANPGHPTFPASLQFLRGTTNFAFPPDRVLWGTVNDMSFAYLAERELDSGIKVFQRLGPVVMAENDGDPVLDPGLPTRRLREPVRVSRFTARDLWELNESRLSTMRARGISRTDLERFHNRALAAREQVAESRSLAEAESLLLSSSSLSHRLYEPLRSSMDDLVTAIVMLLLLTIPFAFAMERLLIGATTIYGRVSGFCGFFAVTFGLLYFLHPGFAISNAPMIIFLAFTVLGLSAIVIQMLIRRFRQELKLLQGQGSQAHDAEVSRAGTMLAAVGMGMSTMRRRPTRTFLTAITVVALTFTILSFASFSREMGIRAVYLSPSPEEQPDGVLIRSLNYGPLPHGIREMLMRFDDGETILTGQWWLQRRGAEGPGLLVTNPANGQSVEIEAMLGIDPREIPRWPALAASDPVAGRLHDQLNSDNVFLPAFVTELLDVVPGDTVLLRGRRVTVGEGLDLNRLQRLRGMDLEPLMPLDPRQIDAADAQGPASEADLMDLDGEVERQFNRLGVGEIAVTSSRQVREFGGQLTVLTLYPSETVLTRELGQTVAALVSAPVWVVSEIGVERMILTQLTQLSGVFAIAIPLLLGGLIIFGTLLGSITDREKEIYTFSALGLGPSHVGMLFFAEAGVYAVVGGMGGQLIAQIVARVATLLARKGIIDPITINFSSTNSLFAIGVVMLLVLVSALYPAYRASKSANPGLAREWNLPDPVDGTLRLTFPFTVSAYDITGVVSFLAEHFRSFDDAGFGKFATTEAEILRDGAGQLELKATLALAPFDLGVTEELILKACPSEIEGIDEVQVTIHRLSGAERDWERGTRVFLKELRTQFLVWRTLSHEKIESYRAQTFAELGEEAQA